MSIHPQEIAVLLNLCPICPDIQYKILMLLIGMNGTPTSNLFKAPNIFTFYTETYDKNKKKFSYSTTPLKPSAYFRDLVLLANYKFAYCSSDEEKEYSDEEEEIEDLSYEAYYETNMAYILTYGDTSSYGYVDYMEKIKTITKNKLNKMIASEPIIEII
jgi:hypothetical protein